MNASSPHLLQSPYADTPRGKADVIAPAVTLIALVAMFALPWLLR
ncbi:hypothetical protein BH10PSE17_BH10PSE17_14700 [soil metagenome]